MTSPNLPLPALGPTETGVVEFDAPCRKCQYNLRSLPKEGRCPECGTPVGLSLHGDLIRYSDPEWLQGLRKGILFILASILVLIFGMVAAVILVTLKGPLMPVFALIGLAYAGLSTFGVWLLTARDPSGIGEDAYGMARQTIRAAVLAGLAMTLLQLGLQSATSFAAPSSPILVVSQLSSIADLLATVAMLHYLSRLALRIPDIVASHRATFLMWGLGFSQGTVLVINGSQVVLGPTRAPQVAVPLGCFSGIAGLAFLVFGIMYLMLLERLGKEFKVQAMLARQTWTPTKAA